MLKHFGTRKFVPASSIKGPDILFIFKYLVYNGNKYICIGSEQLMDLLIQMDNFTDNEKRVLMGVLNCNDDDQLNECLVKIASAATTEYLEMILGKQLPTRANEIWERRLFHLMKHFFIGHIPRESEVSALFQLTENESKNLLRKVRTKFRFDLEKEILYTVQQTLLSAIRSNDKFRVVINSENILEELKHTVSMVAIELEQIQKIPNSAGVYTISEDTFDRICEAYGISIDMLKQAAAASDAGD